MLHVGIQVNCLDSPVHERGRFDTRSFKTQKQVTEKAYVHSKKCTHRTVIDRAAMETYLGLCHGASFPDEEFFLLSCTEEITPK